MRRVVQRIVIYDAGVELRISRRKLRAFLFQKADGRSSTKATQDNGSEDDVICLDIEARLLRCGREVKLVVHSSSTGQTRSQVVPSLVKAVARAYGWYEQILQGKAPDQRSIARRAGLDERYTRRILRCAFLAPDIVTAILDGRQPHGLTLKTPLDKTAAALGRAA